MGALLPTLGKKLKILIIDSSSSIDEFSETVIEPNNLDKFHTPYKSFYGNTFATDCDPRDRIKGLDYSNSYSFGGLGNIWGGAIDLLDSVFLSKHWGVDFDSEYRENLTYFEKRNFLHITNNQNNPLFKIIKSRINKSPESYNFELNPSTLLISSKCIRCNLCLYGCRDDLIFSPRIFFEDFLKQDNVTYEPDFLVTKVEDGVDFAKVIGLKNGQQIIFEAKRIFLGAGPLNTAKIVLRSSNRITSTVVKDSQYFLLPIVGYRKDLNPSQVALSQFNIKYQYSSFINHYQFYSPSTYLENHIKLFLRKIHFSKFQSLAKIFNAHLNLVQGYLPSEKSGSTMIFRDGNTLNSKIYSETNIDYLRKSTDAMFKKLNLYPHHFPLLNFIKIGKIFSGYHFGANFPLSNSHNKRMDHETDIYGRLNEFNRIHIIDGSVLPTIPACSPTFTILSNASRISKLALRLN